MTDALLAFNAGVSDDDLELESSGIIPLSPSTVPTPSPSPPPSLNHPSHSSNGHALSDSYDEPTTENHDEPPAPPKQSTAKSKKGGAAAIRSGASAMVEEPVSTSVPQVAKRASRRVVPGPVGASNPVAVPSLPMQSDFVAEDSQRNRRKKGAVVCP